MSEKPTVIMPCSYHNFNAISEIFLRRIETKGLMETLNHADELTVITVGPDMVVTDECREVQKQNRQNLFNGLQKAGVLPEHFMNSLAWRFKIKAVDAKEESAAAPAHVFVPAI
ncbi:MAG TPA: hypothetical protein PKX38_04350 [Alphaproteobacteria bacterium]|nr:hypothetical protein [Micavibrio sp.]MBK9561673.1 hypothetical protein [Micavibrio sp.]HQX27150.1 hypothetical protein [Alphaproteobacteria bacterium]